MIQPYARCLLFALLVILLPVISQPVNSETYIVDFNEIDAEFLMLQAINTFRYEEGLPLVNLDKNLCRSSRRHAMDMARRNYFDHFTPEGLNPDDRARKMGVPNQILENIGIIRTFGQDIAEVVDALMLGFLESPKHRANLINPDVTHIGIGFYQDLDNLNHKFNDEHDPDALYRGFGTVLVVQDFCKQNVILLEPDPYHGRVYTGEFMTLNLKFSDEVAEVFLRISPQTQPVKSYEVPMSSVGEGFRARFAIENEGAFTIGIYANSPLADWFYREQGRLELTVKSK